MEYLKGLPKNNGLEFHKSQLWKKRWCDIQESLGVNNLAIRIKELKSYLIARRVTNGYVFENGRIYLGSQVLGGVWKIQKNPGLTINGARARKKNKEKQEEEKDFEDGRVLNDHENDNGSGYHLSMMTSLKLTQKKTILPPKEDRYCHLRDREVMDIQNWIMTQQWVSTLIIVCVLLWFIRLNRRLRSRILNLTRTQEIGGDT